MCLGIDVAYKVTVGAAYSYFFDYQTESFDKSILKFLQLQKSLLQ